MHIGWFIELFDCFKVSCAQSVQRSFVSRASAPNDVAVYVGVNSTCLYQYTIVQVVFVLTLYSHCFIINHRVSNSIS